MGASSNILSRTARVGLSFNRNSLAKHFHAENGGVLSED